MALECALQFFFRAPWLREGLCTIASHLPGLCFRLRLCLEEGAYRPGRVDPGAIPLELGPTLPSGSDRYYLILLPRRVAV